MLDEGDAISARTPEPATGLHAAGLGPSGYRFRLPATLSLVPRWNSAAASGSGRVLPVVVPRSYRVMGARDFLAPTWRLAHSHPTRRSTPPLVARLAALGPDFDDAHARARPRPRARPQSRTRSRLDQAFRAKACERSLSRSGVLAATAVLPGRRVHRLRERRSPCGPDRQQRRRRLERRASRMTTAGAVTPRGGLRGAGRGGRDLHLGPGRRGRSDPSPHRPQPADRPRGPRRRRSDWLPRATGSPRGSARGPVSASSRPP